jgi:hypothetical protein
VGLIETNNLDGANAKPGWITPNLILETQKTFQVEYKIALTDKEAIKYLVSYALLAEALLEDM